MMMVVMVMVMVVVMVVPVPDDDRAMMVVMVVMILHRQHLRFPAGRFALPVDCLQNGARVRDWRQQVSVGVGLKHLGRRHERRGLC